MPDPTHVLLVDDDAFNREGMRLYLQREGLAVTEAGDAATAWAAAQSHPLDAAVVDISIPPDSASPSRPSHSFGVQLTHRLRWCSRARAG
jgi:CheY-like chemotaxis protein